MRNFLIHAYFNIDIEEVWKVVQEDMPILEKQIQAILKDISPNHSRKF